MKLLKSLFLFFLTNTIALKPSHALGIRHLQSRPSTSVVYHTTPSSIDQITDRMNIMEVMNRYGMSIDMRDWDSFRKLFTDPVEFDYSSIGEKAGVLHPNEVVKTASGDLGNFQATQHVISNHVVTLDENNDDVAYCRAHVRAMHYLPHDVDDSGDTFEGAGYYDATLVRSDDDGMSGGWKIKKWKYNLLWTAGNPKLFDIARGKSN